MNKTKSLTDILKEDMFIALEYGKFEFENSKKKKEKRFHLIV